jgi:protein phosphatase
VADGVGGHSDGERAATLAVASAVAELTNRLPLPRSGWSAAHIEETLSAAMHRANDNVSAEANGADRSKMGTTMTMAYVSWPVLSIAHAGDSRCYVLRSGQHPSGSDRCSR